VAIKAAVVASDERESDRRMVLNYGHTLAHALEAAAFGPDARWDLRHGEAVAVGLVFAAELARRLGRIDDGRVGLHRKVVGGFDLPFGLGPRADAAGTGGAAAPCEIGQRRERRPRAAAMADQCRKGARPDMLAADQAQRVDPLLIGQLDVLALLAGHVGSVRRLGVA